MNEQNLIKGFNNGYLMKTHMPDLANKFAKALEGRKDSYAEGFLSGIKEREHEILKTRNKKYNPSKSNLNPNLKNKDIDKDFKER